jgi:uncharacterized oligopeptide transporter (OPT) family protein
MATDSAAEPQSVEARDRQWLATVYRGDKEPDLTVRAIVAGMLFGGLMSLSNLYVGLKMGWGLGVDIVALVVIFAVFKALRGIGLVRREFGMMENTMTMTVAVAASWISSAGLVSAVPALTMLTGKQFIWWQLTLFIAVILYLGLFMAIPLKRQMIQVDSLRFPGNIPTGETILVMYAQGGKAILKAVSLAIASLAGMVVAGLRDGLSLIPGEMAPAWRLQRVLLSKLTLTFQPSLIFLGIGALFGMKVGVSMLVGMVLNYAVLAPTLINEKIITHDPPKLLAAAAVHLPLHVKTGQTLTVQLDAAAEQPEFAAAGTPKAQRDVAQAVSKQVLRYTWTEPVVYHDLAALKHDLNAKTQLDGSPSPFYKNRSSQPGIRLKSGNHSHDEQVAIIVFGDEVNKAAVGASKEQPTVTTLAIEAPVAIGWESRLSLPEKQPDGILQALGFQLGANATKEFGEKSVEAALAKQTAKAAPKIGGFRNIAFWSLWPGATVLVVSGLLSLAFQWRTLGRTFASIFAAFGKNKTVKGPLDHIEIPMSWFLIGGLVTGLLAMLMLRQFFGIALWLGAIAVLLTFFLAAVATRAGAETGINPIGAMGKVTQLTYGALAQGNVTANLMTAGVTAGAACSCSDTIGNLKVGHMVGANPRRQFVAQLFGVLAGAILAVPVYFMLVPDADVLGGSKFPAPSALVWMGVAKVLSQGIDTLPPGALLAIAVAFVLAVVIVVVDNLFPKLKPYTPSPAALGIALTVPAYQSFPMFLGALIAWILEKKFPKWHDMYTIPVASGCIAGESLMGVVIAMIQVASEFLH